MSKMWRFNFSLPWVHFIAAFKANIMMFGGFLCVNVSDMNETIILVKTVAIFYFAFHFKPACLSSIPNRVSYADCSKRYIRRNDYEHNSYIHLISQLCQFCHLEFDASIFV